MAMRVVREMPVLETHVGLELPVGLAMVLLEFCTNFIPEEGEYVDLTDTPGPQPLCAAVMDARNELAESLAIAIGLPSERLTNCHVVSKLVAQRFETSLADLS